MNVLTATRAQQHSQLLKGSDYKIMVCTGLRMSSRWPCHASPGWLNADEATHPVS